MKKPRTVLHQLIDIPITNISLETTADGNAASFDTARYRLKNVGILTLEVVMILLRDNPISVYQKKNSKVYWIASGARLFHIAAHTPGISTIPVRLLEKNDQIELRRYLDLVVSPLIQGMDIPLPELFRLLDQPTYREITMIPPYSSSKSAVSRALGVSPSALCSPQSDRKQ